MKRDISKIKHRAIEDPYLHIVLYRPEIPANTGNIARLCAAAEITLHLVYPLGFALDDKRLRRAGLDYWPEMDIRHHVNFNSFLDDIKDEGNLLVFSRHASKLYTEAEVSRGDYLLFGQETMGLPAKVREAHPTYAIPIWGKVRSLNLSTTVGIVTYHYLHQLGRF